MKKGYLAVFIGILMAKILFPDDSIIRFDRLSIEEGLSQSIVECILQDSKGFMWFGTEDGLNKYDGYKFTVNRQIPNNPDSLSHNYVLSIHEDRSCFLWIGTFYGGLDQFDPETGKYTHFRRKRGDPTSLSNNAVRCICEDHLGMLWIGTDDGLNRFDRKTKTFTRFKHQPGNPASISNNAVLTVYEDRSKVLWIGTNGGGLNQFNRDNETFTAYQTGPGNPAGLSHNVVRSIFQDRSGVLWVGTLGGGLNKFDRETGTFSSYQNIPDNPSSISNDHIYSIYEDRSGRFWVGTSFGFNRMDRKTGTFIHYLADPNDPNSLSYNGIRSIYEDRSGVFWIGTYGGGISKFDGKKKKFMHYYTHPNNPNSLSHNIVWCFYEDRDGILWIGTHGGGLNKFDRKNNRFTHYRSDPRDPNSLSHDIVRLVYEDHPGTLWVGTNGGGLNAFDREKESFTVYRHQPDNPGSLSHDELRSIYEDRAGVLWIGTNGGGLNQFNRETGQFKRFRHDENNPDSLSNDFVRCIYEDRQGNFWIGTQGGGLNKFDRRKEVFTHYRYDADNPTSLSNDHVFSIYEDRAGLLWLATWGGGLNRFDRQTDTFTYFGMPDGLPTDGIYGILGDYQGNLWLSTTKGLSRFDPKIARFRNYNERDGLQSNEFNGGSYYKSRSGEMFFGGINGFNCFFPADIKDNPHIPPMVITAFQKLNEEVTLEKPLCQLEELTLSYRDYFFSFEFAALDYTAPQKNQYAYKMEELDDRWITTDSNRRFASYTTLEPGTYTFKVIGSNNDGIWNEEGVSLKIIITPPFTRTLWFRIPIGVAILFFLFYLHRLRTARIRQDMEKTRLEKELRLKADFTAMLVHDLRGPLSALMGYSHILEEKPEQVNITKIGGVISRSSKKMLVLINDMLDFSKFEAGEMKLDKKYVCLANIILDIVEIMTPLFHKKAISLVCDIEPVVRESKVLIDPDKIGQVLNNFLSNAAKFTPERGTVIIEALEIPGSDRKTDDTRSLEVVVTDNGPGVPGDMEKYLFDKYAQLNDDSKIKGTGLGLAVSRLIIEAHGGIIGYRPVKQGKGSTFFFRLPKK